MVVGKSPLTGTWGDSDCGGYFGPELKFAGFDGVIGKPLDADLFPELIQQIEAGVAVWQI